MPAEVINMNKEERIIQAMQRAKEAEKAYLHSWDTPYEAEAARQIKRATEELHAANASYSSSDYDKGASIGFIGLIIIIVVVSIAFGISNKIQRGQPIISASTIEIVNAILVSMTILYTQYINLILDIGYWGTVILASLGVISTLIGGLFYIKHKNIKAISTIIYTLFLSAVLWGLIWLIYPPINPPADYDIVYQMLKNISYAEWMSADFATIAFDISSKYLETVRFFIKQTVGVLLTLVFIIMVISLQISTTFMFFRNKQRPIFTSKLISPIIIAGIAALALGVLELLQIYIS